MGRGVPREAEWGIGIAFIVGMVILLVLAIQSFEGSTSIILLVVAAIFLVVGLFFLTGTDRKASDGPGEAGTAPGSPTAEGIDPRGVRFSQPGVGSGVLVACPSCRNQVSRSFQHCPHCGWKL